MASRKPSARAKRVEAFRAGLGGYDDLFAHEEKRRDELAESREQARYEKACASKNRYASRAEALAVIDECAAHGRHGLSCYRCDYCGGWHLTSHPWKD